MSGAFGHLRGVIGLQHRQALVGGEDQVAVLAERDVRVGAELLLQPPEQRQGELRQPDVLGDRELLVDRGQESVVAEWAKDVSRSIRAMEPVKPSSRR